MKKICSILLLVILLLNSSVLTIISTAVEDIQESTITEDKIKMDLSYTQLTNKLQNEIVITGNLKRNSKDDPLYENPTLTFEMPEEIEKVVINDVKLLYDDELKLGEYKVTQNEKGNQTIVIPLLGKQTEYQSDGINNGTVVRISANLLLKQDIKTTDTKIKMFCVDGVDTDKSFEYEKDIKVINTSELAKTQTIENASTEKEVTIDGIKISTNAVVGEKTLENNDAVYSNEIVKYYITLTNTSENTVNGLKIIGHIPDGMVYANYDEEAFSFWNETYTGLETLEPDENGVYWQDDTYQYIVDTNLKEKEINVDELKQGESKTYSYEVKANSTTEVSAITNIEINLNDKNLYTYTMSNTIKPGEFEVRVRQYYSRTEKNEYSYNIIVKNLSNTNKSGTLTIDIPDIIEISKVKEYYSSNTDYEIKDGKLIVKLNDIQANYFKAVEVQVKVNIKSENEAETYHYTLGASFENGNTKYNSNQCVANGWIEGVSITQSSETSGEKVKEFKEITYVYEINNIGHVIDEFGGYTSITFEDYLPTELSVQSIEYNNFIVQQETVNSIRKYTVTNEEKTLSSVEIAQINGKDNSNGARLKFDLNIKNGEKITIKIKTKVKAFDAQKNNIEISNSAIVTGTGIKTKQSNIVQNTLVHPQTTNVIEIDSDGNVIDNGNTPIPKPDNNSTQTTKAKYSISGIVWVDENDNGQRDNDEELKKGIEVLLYDVSSQKFVTDETGKTLIKTTDENGKYTFTNIYTGQYYVVFKFDSDTYNITEYQKTDISSTENNDAIEKDVNLLGENLRVGLTNTINLNSHKTNIDMGLVEKKNFDLKIEQFINKITVKNDKRTKEYTYNNKKMAKISIHSKQFIGSTVVVEYKIKITNIGDIQGKVYEILDEIPSKMEFHSELNDGWTKSLANTVSNVSYANTDIKPGESIEATITLSKTLEDSDAGVYTSIAKIASSESLKHKEDLNTENNTDKAEVMIEVATGIEIAFKLVGGVIMGLLYVALMIYFIKRVVNRKGMFVIFAIIFATSVFAFSPKEYAYSIEGTMADAQAQIGEMVNSAVAEASKGVSPQVQIILQGYNGKSGSGTFYIYNPDGTYVGQGECLKSGSHFHTVRGKEIVDPETGKIIGYEENKENINFYAIGAVKCDYLGPSEPTITSTTFTVEGADPNGGVLQWTNEGFDFSLGGSLPGEFSASESSALWQAIGSVIDPTNLGTYDMEKIESAIKGGAGINGSATAELLTGSSGVTSLSVTITREITITITVSFSWTDRFKVSQDYKCPNCSATSEDSQEIGITRSASVTKSYKQSFSTTLTFEPEELPKSITIYKFDEDTGEMLYDPDDPTASKFKFLVKGDGQEWTVGVGESITGLHAGTYQVWEIESPYGYGVWEDNYDTSKGYKRLKDIVINEGDVIVIVKLYNKKQFIDISGYVWEDQLTGKDNTRNNLFQDNQYDDKDRLVSGVKVILHDTVRNREFETWTNENGEYHFGSRNENLTYTDDTIRIEDLDKYYIEFEYNGVKYRNVELKPSAQIPNGSRASEEIASGKSDEDSSVRQRFNEKFSTISSGKQIDANGESTGTVIDSNGNVNSNYITYNKTEDYKSTVNYGKNLTESKADKTDYGEEIYHIKATTYKNCDFKQYLNEYLAKENTTIAHVTEIKNINLGLYAREQVDVGLNSDVARFVLSVNGYQHIYKYATLVNPDNDDTMDVRLKAIKGKYYERQLHESTISYSATPNAKLYADITYKIYLQNKSNTLYAKIKELTLDYDGDLNLISYNYENSTNIINTTYDQEHEITVNKQDAKIKEATIDLEKLEDKLIENQNKNVLEVTFRVNADTIMKILNNDQGIKFDFMAEIKTYSTYANNEENKYSRADTEGKYAYASIDKNSSARNVQVQIDNDNSFATDTFENDTTIAPTFKLYKGVQTTLSGIVYEDSPLTENIEVEVKDGENTNKIYQRIGDGQYNAKSSENENVMANVKVELLVVPDDKENKKYESDDARKVNSTSEISGQSYNVAKLYQEAKTNKGQESNVLAVTYTDKYGKYEFKGVVAGKYVIRFTYGKDMKDVDENGNETDQLRDATELHTSDGNKIKTIEAREYKSTILKSEDISKAMNITNGSANLNGDYSWFLKNRETRYSDAVDDVKYRAYLEKDAKINYEILNGKDYVYNNMEAYTPYFKIGVEELNDQNDDKTRVTQEIGDEIDIDTNGVKDREISNEIIPENYQITTDPDTNTLIYKKNGEDIENNYKLILNENGKVDYVYTIDNIDLGIIERPVVDLQVDKTITGLKVSLGNGQVLINGNPSTDNLPYVRTKLDDYVPIEMDTEILHNATIEEEYTITIKNNSELDYSIYKIWDTDTDEKIAQRRNYYYFGSQDGLLINEAVTTRIDLLGDYLGKELIVNDNTMAKWNKNTIDDLKSYNGTNLLSTDNKKEEKLGDGKYNIYTTDTFAKTDGDLVTIGKSKDITYKVSRLLSPTADSMIYTNDVEILQYSGYSQNKDRNDKTRVENGTEYNRYIRKVTTPGNLIPGGAKEDDEDSVRTTITPPTGTIVARWLYVTTIVAGLILVGATVIFIKKRILVK